jgi:RNA polymerase sigma factor (sigma-70 family)
MQQPSRHEVDQTTLSALYQEYAPDILTHLRLHMRSREDAEDVLVETFLAACESQTFQKLAPAQQRVWLWRVARNKVADFYRSTASRRQTLDVDAIANEIHDDEELAPEYLAMRVEEYIFLREQVKKLPKLQQSVLRLRFVQGMTCVQIAGQLGKSDAAVRMLLSRALNLLRSIYLKD